MKATIDRLEGDYAILLFGDKEIKVDFPLALLPEGVKEGSILKVNFEIDSVGKVRQEEKIRGLLERLKKKK